MANMKMEFELEDTGTKVGVIKLIGTKPDWIPYVSVQIGISRGCIQDKDLERFAVNILKAMKSKKLKS